MDQKERKLTKAELERKEQFQAVCLEMARKGYRRRDLTVGVVQANVMALVVMLPFLIGLALLFWAAHPAGELSFDRAGLLLWIPAFAALILLHEGIHGLTWGFFAPDGLHSIRFGFIWQLITPYCTCTQPLKRWQYLLGAAMPTLLLGFGLGVLAVAGGWFWLLTLAEVMLLSGGGDAVIIGKALCYRPGSREVLYYDHPYEGGLVVFEKE